MVSRLSAWIHGHSAVDVHPVQLESIFGRVIKNVKLTSTQVRACVPRAA